MCRRRKQKKQQKTFEYLEMVDVWPSKKIEKAMDEKDNFKGFVGFV